MKVAVMMPAYNAAAFIADALASLLRQRDAAELDIIVVNDGSIDETAEIARSIAADAKEVRLIETANGGVSRARNVALEAVSPDTDLVTWLDADDLSPEGRFTRDIRHFADDATLDLLYGTTCMFRGTGEDRLLPNPDGPKAIVRGVQLGASMFRRTFIERVGRFNEALRFAEDADLFFRAFELSPRIKIVDDLSVYYRRHETNITHAMEDGRRAFARVIMAYTKRRREGSPGIPPGFFTGRSEIEDIDWW